MLTKYTSSVSAELDANKNYWGDKPAWSNLTLLQVPEESTRTAMLKRGEADIVGVSNDNAITLRRSLKKRTLTLRQEIAAPSTAGLREPAGVAGLSFNWAVAAIPIALQALSRASRVAFRMSSVITSSSFGVRFENCPSCE